MIDNAGALGENFLLSQNSRCPPEDMERKFLRLRLLNHGITAVELVFALFAGLRARKGSTLLH